MNLSAPSPAHLDDVDTLHSLLREHAARGNLLPRAKADIYRHIRDFLVVREGSELCAAGALEIMTQELGEIRSLVVSDALKRAGVGSAITRQLILQARELGLKRVMALSYVPAFFQRLGFRIVEKDTLPEKVWNVCIRCYKYNRCDETALLLDLD